jgi:predicted  nucleic acid-binding Zn-ribbon protein
MNDFLVKTHAGARWAACTIGGMLLISITTAIGSTDQANVQDPPIFVFLRLSVPVLVMIVYAAIEFNRAKRSGLDTLRAVRIGQLADSLYFIGFLWTLWALIDSFVIHQLSIALAVFRAFGYALVTTTFGTFLRLLLLQFQTTDDVLEVSHQKVEKDIESFSATLAATTGSVKEFQTSTDEALKGWVEALNRSTASLSEAAAQSTTQAAEQTKALAEALTQLKAQTESVKTAQGGLVTQIESATSAMRTSFDRLRDDLSVSQKGIEALNKSADTLTATVTQVAGQMKGIEGSVAQLAERGRSLETAYTTIVSRIDDGTTALQSSNDRLKEEVERTQQAVKTIGDEMRTIPDLLGPALENAVESIAQAAARTTEAKSHRDFVAFPTAHVSVPKASSPIMRRRNKRWFGRILDWIGV